MSVSPLFPPLLSPKELRFSGIISVNKFRGNTFDHFKTGPSFGCNVLLHFLATEQKQLPLSVFNYAPMA